MGTVAKDYREAGRTEFFFFVQRHKRRSFTVDVDFGRSIEHSADFGSALYVPSAKRTAAVDRFWTRCYIVKLLVGPIFAKEIHHIPFLLEFLFCSISASKERRKLWRSTKIRY
jgi:hypothetical protein